MTRIASSPAGVWKIGCGPPSPTGTRSATPAPIRSGCRRSSARGSTAKPLAAAHDKAHAAFAFMERLGLPFFCFHDRDVAPEGATLRESHANLDRHPSKACRGDGRHRRQAPVGHGQPFGHPRYLAGRRDQSRARGVRLGGSAGARALEATHRLGGENYVLWGGREGYETLLNTNMKPELDQFGRFLLVVAEHKHKIGFKGTLLIEPKPQGAHQAPVRLRYGRRVRLPREVWPDQGIQGQHRGQPRHPRGASFRARDCDAISNGILGSLDINRGDTCWLGYRPIPQRYRRARPRPLQLPGRRPHHGGMNSTPSCAARVIDPDGPVPRPYRRPGYPGARAPPAEKTIPEASSTRRCDTATRAGARGLGQRILNGEVEPRGAVEAACAAEPRSRARRAAGRSCSRMSQTGSSDGRRRSGGRLTRQSTPRPSPSRRHSSPAVGDRQVFAKWFRLHFFVWQSNVP